MFFMILETCCDQLHRVAASRLYFSSFLTLQMLQKIPETTKHFINFFQKKYKKGRFFLCIERKGLNDENIW